jgi:hypothetical protein
VPDEAEVSEAEQDVEDVEADEDGDEEMVDEDEEQEGGDEDDDESRQQRAEGVARLRFNQTLNWRAGRPIAVADLLRRLESLARELQGYEQDEVAVDSLQTAAKELASPQLLAHKDKGVKALTASCVVDVFRLCAPNAPYTQQQMKVCLPDILLIEKSYRDQWLTVRNTGHLHAHRQGDISSTCRSLERIQSPTFVCTEVAR